MTIYEIIGTVTGVAGVWLAARENIWTWPAGMVSTLLLVYVCYEARLYADVGLNAFYFFTSAYGWYAWRHYNTPNSQAELPITRTQSWQWLWLIIFSVIFTLALGYTLTHFTNADLSYTDSATTGASLAAYWMMARKKLENWLVWLVVDSVYVGIYLYKELYLLADILDRFQIVGKKDLFPHQLSGGQQQLVGIARAVVASPKLILADEPTGNLNSRQGEEIMELFQRLNQEGTTIIQVTHSEKNATYGTRILNLLDGRIEKND